MMESAIKEAAASALLIDWDSRVVEPVPDINVSIGIVRILLDSGLRPKFDFNLKKWVFYEKS